MKRRSTRPVGAVVGAALVAIASQGVALADVTPGQRITADDVDKVKDLVSPGIQWCVRQGMPMVIGETKKIVWPERFKQATEKYSAQVKISADGLNIENYVAGQPFPVIDANDPKVAVKIIWNYGYDWALPDDSAAMNFDADTGPIFGGDTPLSIERHFLIESVRAMRYTGRLDEDPKPVWESREGFAAKSSLNASPV